jgi:hypothetical protein
METLAEFVCQYSGSDLPREPWRKMLAAFDHEALRQWARALGVETFAASTGRVYPVEMKAAPLLRRWVRRLHELGVRFAMHHRWRGLRMGKRIALNFQAEGREQTIETDAAIFALGGASWPETGSDGAWIDAFAALGLAIAPIRAANCGWEIDWPDGVRAIEGKPLKNVVLRAGDGEAAGEAMVTRYGLEGGAIYQLGPTLRAMEQPVVAIDFKPGVTVERLIAKMNGARLHWQIEARNRWKLSDAAMAILTSHPRAAQCGDVKTLANLAKSCAWPVRRARPIEEAISSAGGVRWSEIDERLMLRKLPGVFVAGEMIDWEAPTGGYLMQGCFATGTHAAMGALNHLKDVSGKKRKEH